MFLGNVKNSTPMQLHSENVSRHSNSHSNNPTYLLIKTLGIFDNKHLDLFDPAFPKSIRAPPQSPG